MKNLIINKKYNKTAFKPSIVLVKSLFFIYSLLLLLISLTVGGVLTSVTLYFLFTLSVIIIFNRGTMTDPRMLFVGFLFLYSSFYPLRVALTEFSLLEINYNFLKQSLNYSFLGAVVFVNVANLSIKERNININFHNFKKIKKNNAFYLSEKLLFFIFLPVVLFMLFYVLVSGAEAKADVGGPIVQIGHFSLLIMITIIAISIARLKGKFYKNHLAIGFLLLSLLYVLITGERDALFRTVLIIIFIIFDYNKKANPLVIIALLSLAAVMIPVSQAFKSVLLSGQLEIPSIGMRLILSNEFISASRNIYSLILFEAEQSIEFLFTDVGRAFIPNILLPDINLASTTSWFHYTFRVEHGFEGRAGWGFGIIAFGYLIGGGFGVAFVMSIYSAIICFFFNKRATSIYWYIFYLLMLIIAIYCIRADLANFLSQSFKVTGTFILLLIFSHFVMRKDLHNKLQL